MEVYWQMLRKGQRLILSTDQGQLEEIGGVRETKKGFDAFAKTFGYDPGRAQKGIPSMEEAKDFVESFSPWEMYGVSGEVGVDPQVRPEAV